MNLIVVAVEVVGAPVVAQSPVVGLGIDEGTRDAGPIERDRDVENLVPAAFVRAEVELQLVALLEWNNLVAVAAKRRVEGDEFAAAR